MEEKKSLWDWPFENKWKTSALVLALFNLPSIRNGELSINERGIISNYYWNPPLELNIMVFMASAYYLSLFGKIKIPRIKNFFKATSIAFRGSIAYLRDNTEESIKSERTFIKYLHNPQGKLESLTEAKDLIRKGKDLDTAMEYYLEYLDAEPEKKRDFSEYFFSSVVEAIIRAKARRNNLYDLLNEAFFDLKEGNKTRLFEQDWKKILRKDSSLEIRIVYASFLSICNMPEAQETWKEIEKEKSPEKILFGESKNKVYEFKTPHFKEIILIKEGKEGEFEKEWETLQALKKRYKEKEKISVTGLAYYTTKEKDTLLTKRKAELQDLNRILPEETSKEKKEQECKAALKNLAKFHNLKLYSPPYNPIPEMKRRLIDRIGKTTKEAEIFFETYKEFHARRTLGEEYVTAHGDLYPSNVLEGGILIDFEKRMHACPWFDIETFFGAPYLQALNQKELLESYRTKRQLKDAGDIFYKIHVSLCQIGSFSIGNKHPVLVNYFTQRTKEKMYAYEEYNLKEKFDHYLESIREKA
ncbi:MAG TPA: hypothetical protein HA360_02465 [Nanoarchaeota archaeon]|nr:hypothetical protein [Candidatus Woesearchaeota archaeon]HIH15486.1 hypothetical protein [Nanoarchaeota archaeon]HIH59289.1 hypothetical protein [Nanoarchaeota archaeon]HII13916.1 hypothetical protein [Nanoarchaeota archaeon]HIJ04674.1 hypothetical protein [Nanoarchaeota archaeon]